MNSSQEKISAYIKDMGQVTVDELLNVLPIGRAMVHRHLKALVDAGSIRKIGSAPRVWYVPDNKTKEVIATAMDIKPSVAELINDNFLLITPKGEKLDGVAGFSKWCLDREYDLVKKSIEYEALHKKYSAFRENGLLNGITKMCDTVKNDCYVDQAYYIDFYAWEIFGKTKLGQLLLYAKQGQDRQMIKEIAKITEPFVKSLINKYGIDAIGYIPPTVKRFVQVMDVIKKNIHASLPDIKLIKATAGLRVPQKTLSKLQDRVENARETIIATGGQKFKNVLLIDDAVGSGATFNETARKLKKQGIAEKVICLAIVGSLKGFDVISEV